GISKTPGASKIQDMLGNFKDKNILIIGDIMLDKYVFGEVSRISPEAPVQVLDVLKESYVPGGAANVANNIVSLGANAIMIGLVGNDSAGKKLIFELKKRNIDCNGVFIDDGRPTIQKIRIVGKSQQLLRIDFEDTRSIDGDISKKIRNCIEDIIKIKGTKEVHVVVVSDYAKGIITERLMKNIAGLCKTHEKILIIDPKPQHKSYYAGASLITPNHKEAVEMAGFHGGCDGMDDMESDYEAVELGKKLIDELGTTILLTRGNKGMSLFETNGKIIHIPTRAKEVYDVSGAGDTVVGTLALALAANASMKDAAILANHAAGITVGKFGTSTVTIDEIRNDMGDE
ncbi:MAG: D-glycero-beta-D-manno-heptose-7-phosphate kinase, partial [Thermodesulfovibrionia bacterium]|nr:D-glycero-beta-D-manno-heptose-7-phosphate kinase [Thermodesulfovibrionia bacterium]